MFSSFAKAIESKKITIGLLFSLFFLIVACQEKKVNLTLEEDKLVMVLLDLQIAEAALQNVASHQKDSLAELYYNQVFDKNKVNEDEIMLNIAILKQDLKLEEKIFKEVTEKLKKIENSLKREK